MKSLSNDLIMLRMRSVAHGTFRRFYGCSMIRGIKPEDLPVEQPTKFDLIVNLKTA